MKSLCNFLFQFKGRVSRLYFLIGALGVPFLVSLISLLVVSLFSWWEPLPQEIQALGTLVMILVGLAVMVSIISFWVRRLHDLNFSGWWILGIWAYGFILDSIGGEAFMGQKPIVYTISALTWLPFLLLLFVKGTEGANRFGEDPRLE
jgi:uncharacterized membrane protein YhaH (DUF805 family)